MQPLVLTSTKQWHLWHDLMHCLCLFDIASLQLRNLLWCNHWFLLQTSNSICGMTWCIVFVLLILHPKLLLFAVDLFPRMPVKSGSTILALLH
jgi:hypothetical protein